MPWVYVQSTGAFYDPDGNLLENGHAGHHEKDASNNFIYRNQPDKETVKNRGPIPRGQWKIGGYTSNKGPLTITLTPVGHNAHGRTDFRIHGNNSTNTASEGCIIVSRKVRQAVVNSSDKQLEVVGYEYELIDPWVYIQRSGELYTPEGRRLAVGNSGEQAQRDFGRPVLQNIPHKGPIPCGLWKMGFSTYGRGLFTIPLTPVKHSAHGRSNLCIHGDGVPRFTAEAYGGIVLPENARRRLAGSNVRYLKVIRSHYGMD